MSNVTEEKEKNLTIDQNYGGFLYTENISHSNKASIVNISSNSNISTRGVTFLDKILPSKKISFYGL